MGAKISSCYSSYKSRLKSFKLFLNFLPNGPHRGAEQWIPDKDFYDSYLSPTLHPQPDQTDWRYPVLG